MLVHDFLTEAAARTPDAVALIEPGRTVSYGELEALVGRVAGALAARGVGPGERVVLALDNSVELVACYLGAMKAGAVAVPLPSGPKSDRLARAILDCTPAAVIVDAATLQDVALREAVGRVPIQVVYVPARRPLAPGALTARAVTLADLLRDAPEAPPRRRRIDQDLAAIIYTSGSTGEPRGVMLTHLNIRANTDSIVHYLGLTARDRVMCILPFYYVYGLSLLHTHLRVGGSIVIDNRFTFPNVVLEAMRTHAVTGFAGVPSTFAILLQRAALESMAVPSLRYVTQAGGSMPPARILEWLQRGPGVPFFVMYGATEASARLTFLDPGELPRKVGSIGRPIPNVEIVVLTEDGREAAPGETGELVARGSNIAAGYWNEIEESARRFGPSTYRTGDLGYADDEGYLFLVGRRHDMIKVGAHRVGAKEIENVLHEHPAVLEAAVVGVPHDILGEAPVAAVVLRNGHALDEPALAAFCHGRLAPHKVPVRFAAFPDLPKLAMGKIDRAAIRRHVGEGAPAAAEHAGVKGLRGPAAGLAAREP